MNVFAQAKYFATLAALEIDRRGWCQGQTEDDDGRLDMLGAFHRVVAPFERLWPPLPPDSQAISFAQWRGELTATLARIIAYAAIPKEFVDSKHHLANISLWNDAPGRTQEEVVSALWASVGAAPVIEIRVEDLDSSVAITDDF